MKREGAESSMHARLMAALSRGAEVQEHSRAIAAAHVAADKRLGATLASSRRARKERERARDVRNQTRG